MQAALGRGRAMNTTTIDFNDTSFALSDRLVDSSPFLIWFADSNGDCTYFNQAWHAFTGRSLAEQLGRGWLAWVHADDAGDYLERLEASVARKTSFEAHFRLRRHDGQYRWLHGRIRPLLDEGWLIGYGGYAIDVSDLKQAQEVEANVRMRLELAATGTNEGIWDRPDWNVEGEYWSPRLYELLGYAEGDIDPSFGTLTRLMHPDDRARLDHEIARAVHDNTVYDNEYRLRLRSGEYRWFRSRAVMLRDAAGRPQRMTGSLEDIHERRLAQLALQEEKEKAEVTLASLHEGVITVDAGGCVEYMNGAAERLLGCELGALIGSVLDQAVPVFDDDGERVNLRELFASAASAGRKTIEAFLTPRPGRRTVVEISVAPLRANDHGRHGDIIVLRDVTAARRMARRLAHQATHDPLTNLVNRREFERRLERILNSARSDDSEHALCYIDLDQFKVINDSCGHSAGDELLKQIARLLRGAVRKRDTVCRLGGDEFGVLMEHCALGQAEHTANLIRERTAAFRFIWESRPFSIGTSIGVVPIGPHSDDLAGVMRRADAACYAAKEQGRNRVHVYHDDDAEMARMHSEMRWVARINHALEDGSFELYCQPVYAAAASSAAPPYYEFLLRMRQGADILLPGLFLPAAERYGLADKIDRWVIGEALARLAGGSLPGGPDAVWAVNVSGASLGDDGFASHVLDALDVSGIDGRRLCFEITETAAIYNLSSAQDFCERLRARGCRFALDDFGSGLSSFAYLKTLPVDYLKIDGVFVRDLDSDLVTRGIIKAIIDIGHLVGSTTIAEFVETEALARELSVMGADYLQGFHFARPQPLALGSAAPAEPTDLTP